MIYTGIATIQALSLDTKKFGDKEYSFRTVHVKISQHIVKITYTDNDKRNLIPWSDDWLVPGIQVELSHSMDGYYIQKEISDFGRKHPYTEWEEAWPCNKVFGIELNPA